MESLDPRVERLPSPEGNASFGPTKTLDQFPTYEVFVQPKEGKPFQHEGIVHAPNLEMAYLLAKETFTRRFLCHSLYVVETSHVHVSPTTDGEVNVYDRIKDVPLPDGEKKRFEVYHLARRGKQHLHAGTIEAGDPASAFSVAKRLYSSGKNNCNVWVIPTDKIRFTTEADMDLWKTLPDKKFRDALAYKGGDKLKDFLEASR
jgi:ring-1,2-phenylacetyl-CoA epoxidase subunit PaaB